MKSTLQKILAAVVIIALIAITYFQAGFGGEVIIPDGPQTGSGTIIPGIIDSIGFVQDTTIVKDSL